MNEPVSYEDVFKMSDKARDLWEKIHMLDEDARLIVTVNGKRTCDLSMCSETMDAVRKIVYDELMCQLEDETDSLKQAVERL